MPGSCATGTPTQQLATFRRAQPRACRMRERGAEEGVALRRTLDGLFRYGRAPALVSV
jgi:hypothetical protein